MNVRAALLRMSHGAEVSRFYLSWATVIEAGLSQLQGLATLVHASSPPAVVDRVEALDAALQRGASLSDAVAQRGSPFSTLEAALVTVGEKHGRLVEALRGLASFFEQDHAATLKIRRRLVYPSFVAFTGSAVSLLPLAFRFSPAAYFGALGLAWALFALLGGGLVLKAFAWERGRERFTMARLCRVLALAMEASISTPEALSLSAKVLAPSPLSQALTELAARVDSAMPLSDAFASTGLVPHTVVTMLITAERTGETSRTLRSAARMYETGVL